MRKLTLISLSILCLLSACSDEPAQKTLPTAAELTRQATGYYTQMIVADSPGPKAQIWLSDKPTPIWFGSVRDAIKFTRTPEEADNIIVIYVTDVGANTDFKVLDMSKWLTINDAVFVINSQQKDGMGLAEAIPFADETNALNFIKVNQGELIKGVDNISDDYLNQSVKL